MPTHVAATADVDGSAVIGAGCAVWDLAQVRERAALGERCVVGRGAYIGPGVALGDSCKIQNYALLYEPARLGSGVFVGPGAILTNDRHPRAVTPDGVLKQASDWDPVGVTLEDGASVGAGAICVAPVTVGRWAMVAAGSVVVHDVPAFALVAGTPARRIGWVGQAGQKLEPDRDGVLRCPATGRGYVQEAADRLVEADA